MIKQSVNRSKNSLAQINKTYDAQISSAMYNSVSYIFYSG